MSHRDYWAECIANAAQDGNITLTLEQIDCLAEAVEGGHENFGMAFYSPPASDRLNEIRREGEQEQDRLRREANEYRRHAEYAIRRALGLRPDASVSIEGTAVYLHDGRTTRIQ